MLNALIVYFVVFGGLFSLVLGLGRITARDRARENHYLAALFICLGILLLSFSVDQQGLFIVFPHAGIITILTMPLLGPLLYVYFSITLNVHEKEKRYRLIHIWPAPVMLLLLAPIVFRPAEFKSALYSLNLYSEELRFLAWYQDAVYIAMMMVMLVYLGAVLRRLSFLWDARGEKTGRLGLLFVGLAGANILSYLIAQATDGGMLYRISSAMTTAILVGIFLAGQRDPMLLSALRVQAARARYEKSRIKGLDVQAVVNRMGELMENEKLYSDEDLTLADMARELTISSHQLSQILNEQLSKSFKNYVNEYRVAAALEMLEREPERTILSISAAAGFNSKSSFNSVFRTVTGKTPSEYRKEKAGEGN